MDNINAKNVYEKNTCHGYETDVNFLDIAFSRFLMNFVASSSIVLATGNNVWKDVPKEFRIKMGVRSFLLTCGQTANVFSINLLPLSILTIC
jgi:hypothetical protein